MMIRNVAVYNSVTFCVFKNCFDPLLTHHGATIVSLYPHMNLYITNHKYEATLQ